MTIRRCPLQNVGDPHRMASLIMEQLQIHSERTTAHVKTILKLEAVPLFTQNTHYLADKRDNLHAQYKQARPGSANMSGSSSN